MRILLYSLVAGLVLAGCGVMNNPLPPKDFPKTQTESPS